MRRIKLLSGNVALVDDEDFDYLNQFKWQESNGYAVRRHHIKMNNGKQIRIMMRMHRIINNTPKGFFTDHVNGQKLDNRKNNLRTATKSQNGLNRTKQKNNTSGFKGVSWHTQTKKWIAQFTTFGKHYSLGLYDDPREAHKAYLNFVSNIDEEFSHA